jgi:hypothetical protein
MSVRDLTRTLIRSRALAPPALVGLLVVSACASAAPIPAPVGRLLTAPLATSSTTSAGTWAIVPMGHLKDPLNTFWQVFFRPTTGTWNLVTPRGVADNGGLVMTADPDQTATVGFLPNQNLRFSPLARTSDDGTTWSPGLIQDALLAAPDVVSGSKGDDSYALVTSGGGRVLVAAASDFTTWRTLIARQTLLRTPGGRSCGIGRMAALAVNESGRPLIGATCTKGTTVGIFGMKHGRWRLVGPHIPGRSGSTVSTVLRLIGTGSAVSSLLDIDDSGRLGIVAASSGDGSGRWTVSTTLAIDSSERILSTAINHGGGYLVETTGKAGSTGLSEIASPAANWQMLPSPPVGTRAVAAGPDNKVDALSVNNSKLTVWELTIPSHTWRRTQVINVPIFYGSSD